MKASISALSMKSRVLLAMALVLGAAQTPAFAAPACGELFESQYEGLLHNRAARAAMLFKLKAVLPEGRHQVVAATGQTETLGISYSPIGEAQIILGQHPLVTTVSSYLPAKGPNDNVFSTDARVQLLDGNRLLLSNSQTSGNYLSIEGLRTRDVGVQFDFLLNGGGTIQVTETITTRSQYRPTNETYTTRRTYQVSKPAPGDVVVVR